MKYQVLTVLLVLWLLTPGWGQNYPTFPIGESWRFPDARSLGLGGAGTVSQAEPGAMLYNPAALTRIGDKLVLTFTLGGRKFEERRSFPLYDRFNGVIGNGIYVENNNWYFQPEGAVAIPLPVAKAVLSLGSYLEIDQDYRYNEEVRQNIFGDSLLAYNQIEFDGGLRRYGAAFALPVIPGLSVGMQFSVLGGKLHYSRKISFVRQPEKSQAEEVCRTLDNLPTVLSLGTIYRFNERITAGLDVSLPYTVKYVAKGPEGENWQEEIGHPLRINAGFEYRAQQILQARLNIDFAYEFWSDVNYQSNVPTAIVVQPGRELTDVYKVRIGIEHIFYNQIPFRVGIQYRNSYLYKGQTQTLFSLGTGFFGDRWKVDVAGAVTKSTYKWPDLFDDRLFGGDRSNSPTDDVEELTFLGRITLQYFLNW